MNTPRRIAPRLCLAAALMLLPPCAAQAPDARSQAREILREAGLRGGLVLHLGCGDGALTAALGARDSFLVHGLDRDPAAVARARASLRALGLYGRIAVDRLRGERLPYVDNLANLIVVEKAPGIAPSELLRVLAPGGVALVRAGDRWQRTVKPRPAQIDEWTHYLHDPSNNAVAHDELVGPPRHLQWIGSPRWARHHDHMASMSAMVSAAGRVFYILDEGSRASILLPPKWSLIARDAFNGTLLWKRPITSWYTHLWRLKSGPALLPRRLVASGDRVYVTLGMDAPLTALDAASGKTLQTFAGSAATDEILLCDGVLFLAARVEPSSAAGGASLLTSAGFWGSGTRRVLAIEAASGRVLWQQRREYVPLTLAAGGGRIFFHDGRRVVCLKSASGEQLWASRPVAVLDQIPSWFGPSLVVHGDTVLFAGGENMNPQRGGSDTMTALAAATGEILWKSAHGPSGYRSPEDLLVAGGLVWEGATTSGKFSGIFAGHDLQSGEVRSRLTPDVESYWFHHRCYRSKATDRYLMTSRTGIEFLDLQSGHMTIHHWARGGCLYGIMPCNGLVYLPPHDCACYPEAKLYGLNALAATGARASRPREIDEAGRREGGPALERTPPDRPAPAAGSEWPTYRGDRERCAFSAASVPLPLATAWKTRLGGRLSSPTIAGGRLFVAAIDAHTLHALDAGDGHELWSHTAGGRIDSPPTLWRGRVLFGSADGWVTCLDSSDGALVWRFRAAPLDERLGAFEQLESVWPVHGSVLVENGVVYCVAGRSMFLDGGLHLLRLDAASGRKLSETIFDERRPGGGTLQDSIATLNMPVALADILSSDGERLYMRSQVFDLKGQRLELGPHSGKPAEQAAVQRGEQAHLFAPFGFLDGSWFHRSYWVYGRSFAGGFNGYFQAGKFAPAGRILALDGRLAFGFARLPQYYRWTTPLEYHLFCADCEAPRVAPGKGAAKTSMVRIAKSASLDPRGTALTVQAWVLARKPGGVILAHGGPINGYALFLRRGKPAFALRAGKKLAVARASGDGIAGRWTHLAGVLNAGGELQLYVDGELRASTRAPAPLTVEPVQALQIGADEGGAVGSYRSPFGFSGIIDEVSIHHRALAREEIAARAAGAPADARDRAELVLRMSFDGGAARDSSGRGNHGQAIATRGVAGHAGGALLFTARKGAGAQTHMQYRWAHPVPLLVRAMVLTPGALFIAGPPDLVDEEEAKRNPEDAKIKTLLAEQDAALAGHRGALLWAVGRDDGVRLSACQLETPPVWDGMAAAGGRLYLATTGGEVLCLGARER